jgi:hypothetical protein
VRRNESVLERQLNDLGASFPDGSVAIFRSGRGIDRNDNAPGWDVERFIGFVGECDLAAPSQGDHPSIGL